MEDRICNECGNVIEEGEEYLVTEDGRVLCSTCVDFLYATCDRCGKLVLEDDLQFWGDSRLCPECMEENCPSFDEEENEEETEEAYQEMLEKYLGRSLEGYSEGEHTLEYRDNNGETDISYSLSIKVNKAGRIVDISRLHAMMLLSESITSSNWEPYPIDEYDYEWVLEEMLEDCLEEDEEDDSEEE